MEVSDQRHDVAAVPRGEQNPGTLQIGSWVSRRAEMDFWKKENFLAFAGIRTSGCLTRTPVLKPTTLSSLV